MKTDWILRIRWSVWSNSSSAIPLIDNLIIADQSLCRGHIVHESVLIFGHLANTVIAIEWLTDYTEFRVRFQSQHAILLFVLESQPSLRRTRSPTFILDVHPTRPVDPESPMSLSVHHCPLFLQSHFDPKCTCYAGTCCSPASVDYYWRK